MTTSFPPDTAIQEFPSSSSSKVYTVKTDEEGALWCSCPAWRFKKKGKPRGCKHTQAVMAGQAPPPPDPAPPAAEPLSAAEIGDLKSSIADAKAAKAASGWRGLSAAMRAAEEGDEA